MSDQKKVRPEAVLKNLPAERQEQVYEKLGEKTLREVRAWLAEDGLKVSLQTISEFRSWYASRLQAQLREQRVLNYMEVLRKQSPELSEEKLAQYGASVFNLQAIEEQDPKLFLAIQTAQHKAQMDRLKLEQRERQIQQRQEGLELEKARFQRETAELFLKWAADQRAKEIAGSNESNAEKIERLGQLMFGEDWKPN